MKSIFYILLSFFAISNNYCQIPKANFHTDEHEYYDFEGKVKSCEIRNLNEEGEYHWSLVNNKNQDLYYSIDRQLLKRTTYNIDGFLYADSLYADTYWTYHYDGDKLLNVNVDDTSDTLNEIWQYDYPADSIQISYKITKILDTLGFKKIVSTLNSKSKYTKIKADEYTLSSISDFDDDNKLTSYRCFDKEENMSCLQLYSYTLDTLNNETMIHYKIDTKRNDLLKTVEKYNEYGDKIVESKYDKSDKLLWESFFDYEYDDHNNWIKKMSKSRIKKDADFNIHFTTRNITYFE
jgi:hypothetical protein